MSDSVDIRHGDSREVLKTLADNSIDSCVCDPPYALVSITKRFGKEGSAPAKGNSAYMRASAGFMNQAWDNGECAFDPEFWREVFRVLKPGAHLVAFSGTRTYHRMVCAIEDAGFEIREMHAWIFGSGFPKSHDVSKAIDRAAGATREIVQTSAPVKRIIPGADQNKEGWEKTNGREYVPNKSKAATDDAREWEGWGTATKPAMEPICLARKPLSEKTVAANVLRWGTGALNIDGCRIEAVGRPAREIDPKASANGAVYAGRQKAGTGFDGGSKAIGTTDLGRWPANVVTDGSDEVIAAFPDAPGQMADASKNSDQRKTQTVYGAMRRGRGEELSADSPNEGDVGFKMKPGARRGDEGSAARFFYAAKADGDDRLGSSHPTVKPIDLMQWLVRLVTPKRTFVYACQTCNNPPHEDSKMQGVQSATEAAQATHLLFGELPSERQNHSATEVQDMRVSSESAGTDLLLAGMLSKGKIGSDTESSSEALPVVRSNIQADEGRRSSILLPGMCREGNWHGEKEDTSENNAGVLDSLSTGEPNGDKDRISHGTPSGNVSTSRKTSDAKRSRAPRQRKQDGQSGGEFGSDDKTGPRQNSKNTEEQSASLSPLQRKIPPEQLCKKCGGALVRIERKGLVLDPFAGTGTTGEACIREGMRAVLIEREERFVADIRRRMSLAMSGADERSRESIKAKIASGRLKDDPGPLFSELK